ncbi:hypothetical protein [Mesorhizobium sp. CAU 1741]|uniref:hypothetical protein n=1 Tax=Mesorhizobium sp. CAU 1741 TaxID=3140366 RepID=UPI00325A6B39
MDITGERYGRLVALEILRERQGTNTLWRFKCDCGNVTIQPLHNVRHGTTESCGCLRDEILVARVQTHGHRKASQTSRTLNQYNHAKNRCFNPRNKRYAEFGGRGISMDPEWKAGFVNFLATMGECPPGLSLQRMDKDGDFEPGNCFWAPAREISRRVDVRKTPPKRADAVDA